MYGHTVVVVCLPNVVPHNQHHRSGRDNAVE